MGEDENQFKNISERKSNTVTDEDNFKRVEEYLYLGERESVQAYLNCVNAASARKIIFRARFTGGGKLYNGQREKLKKRLS